MGLTFWLAVLRILAYATLAPVCLALALDGWNLGRHLSAWLFFFLSSFFLLVLMVNVLDLVEAREATRIVRMAATPSAVGSAVIGVALVVDRLRNR